MKYRNRILSACFVTLFLFGLYRLALQPSAGENDSPAAVPPILQYYDSLPGNGWRIVYNVNGGRNHPQNPVCFSGKEFPAVLRRPYRSGYYFSGWYLDSRFRMRVETLRDLPERNVMLYAKWTPRIDNEYNVQNYPYRSAGLTERDVVYLKDCTYRFWEELEIPGMPRTRDNDLLNNYIFSLSQCPQGLCLTDEFVLLTSYSEEDDCLGELMVFDRESGRYLVTLGMDSRSHLGGIAYDGENVWVCNSEKNTIERISYDFIQLMAKENANEVVDATELVDTYPVQNKPSCIAWYGGRLWIATHTLYINSRMTAYYFDRQKDELQALSRYKIPSKVQGIAFDEEGFVYLSTSYGRNMSSYIKIYSSIIDLASHPNSSAYTIELPPGSEEIDISEGILYVIFESAGEKYLEGTDGKGQSHYPLDRILMVTTASLQQ